MKHDSSYCKRTHRESPEEAGKGEVDVPPAGSSKEGERSGKFQQKMRRKH